MDDRASERLFAITRFFATGRVFATELFLPRTADVVSPMSSARAAASSFFFSGPTSG